MKAFKHMTDINTFTTPIAGIRYVLNAGESAAITVPVGAKYAKFKTTDKFYVIPDNNPVDFPQFFRNCGYQKIIIDSKVVGTTPTNLNPSTTYTATFVLDSTTVVNFSMLGSSLTTFNDLISALNSTLNPINGSGATLQPAFDQNSVVVYSATVTPTSSLEILSGSLFEQLAHVIQINPPATVKKALMTDIIPEYMPSTLYFDDTIDVITIQASDETSGMGGSTFEIYVTFFA